MNKTTYTFHESGAIPGIPRDEGGEGHAGLHIDVDLDSMTVLDMRLRDMPESKEEVSVEDEYSTQPLANEDEQEAEHQVTEEQQQPEPESTPLEVEQIPFPNEVPAESIQETEPVQPTQELQAEQTQHEEIS